MRHALRVLIVASACAAIASRVCAQVATSASPVSMVRCTDSSDVPCLRATVPLRPEEARAATDSASEWRGKIAGVALNDGIARSTASLAHPLTLLVLVDISGSMKGQGIELTRSALRTFISELPRGSVRVAVAPFASRRLAPQIRAATFTDPQSALAQVDALPQPEGNTGLYSAVEIGSEVVKGALQNAPADAWGALLVITDGRNDVRAGDDPGLLSGAAGRDAAVNAVASSGSYVWLVGIGDAPDGADLQALAGTHGERYLVAEDPLLLHRVFTGIRDALFTTRALTYPAPAWARTRLARGIFPMTVSRGDGRGCCAAVVAGRWTPPLYALPAFSGVADSGTATAQAITSFEQSEARVGSNVLVFAFFALVALILWFVLPRMLWPDESVAMAGPPAAKLADSVAAAAPAARAAPKSAVPEQSASAGGVRRGVTEVSPRRPTEVTGAFARRVVK
ncbi:MAG: VWA domain-containing protein [Gemmatimonadaceae bacterium]|nr:VWA domain-containing protein [Gemmatimonadaceae bacterium]